jgi:hypothetical protein
MILWRTHIYLTSLLLLSWHFKTIIKNLTTSFEMFSLEICKIYTNYLFVIIPICFCLSFYILITLGHFGLNLHLPINSRMASMKSMEQLEEQVCLQVWNILIFKKLKWNSQLATGEEAPNWQNWRAGGCKFEWVDFAKINGDDWAQRFSTTKWLRVLCELFSQFID